MKKHPKSTLSKPRDPVVIAIFASMVLVVLLTIFTIIKLNGLNNTPSWWAALDNDPDITEQTGIELENRITSALTRLRPEDNSDWNAAIDQDQLNSWLTHRLADTVRSFSDENWIEEIDTIRTTIDTNTLIVGVRIMHAHGSTTIWATIHLSTNDQGAFDLRTKKLYIGSTRVPARLAKRYINEGNLGKARVDLGDGREVRIRAIRTGDERLEFALRTQPKE